MPLRLTIVTPSFNQDDFIGEAIDSVLSQRYPDLEYFVIDGGSSDGTVETLQRYQGRLQWVSEPDQGQADAINKGFARATGDVVTFLNSDDYYFPGALEAVARAFDANPEAGIVHGRGTFVSVDGKPLQTVGGAVDAGNLLYGVYPTIPQPAVFFRRSVIDTIGGLDASFHYALDGEFFLRAFSNFRAVFIPEALAALRVQPGSKSVMSGEGFAPEILRMVRKAIAFPDRHPLIRIDRSLALAAAHLNSARFLYNNGRYRAAVKAWGASLTHSRKYAGTIFFRQLPRLILRLALGKDRYERASRLVARTA